MTMIRLKRMFQQHYFRVTTEGDPDLFFDVAPTTDNGEANEAQTPLPTAVDEAINGHSEKVNTIEALQSVVEIDNDNEPAEENVPTTTTTSNRSYHQQDPIYRMGP